MLRPRYFRPKDVSLHNMLGDTWVSYLGKMYNLTALVEESKDALLKPIIEFAGKDISHWFDPKTKDLFRHVDPLTSCIKYYTDRGPFIHVPPSSPRTDWVNDFGRPWWRDVNRFEVGLLSTKTRWIRIINTLTSEEQRLEVCSEETLDEILQRYMRYNVHAASYTWKHNGVNLDMSKTLCENNILEEDEFYCGSIDCNLFSPSVCLYFNDDLTEC